MIDSSPENASAIRTDDLDTVAIAVDEVTNTTQITGVIHKHSSNPNYLPLTVYNNDSLQVTLANGDTLTTAASYVYDAVNQRYDVSAQINTCEPITSVRVKGNGPGSVTIYDWWGDQYLVNNYQGIADNTILSQEDPYEIPSDVTYTIDVGNIVGGIADSVTIALGGSLPASAQLDLTITDGTNSYTGVHDAGLDAYVFTNIPTGTYDCTLARGACTMTVSILIDGTTAVGEASLPGVSLFPAPAHDRLTVRHQGAPFVHYRIRSLAGQLVAQGSLQGNTIAIGGLAPGAYLLHLVPATGAPVRERFIKQ